MSDRNRVPGPEQQGPDHEDQDGARSPRGSALPAAVRATWGTPAGKVLALVPAVLALGVGLAAGAAAGGGGGSTPPVSMPGQTVTITTGEATPPTSPGGTESTTAGPSSPGASNTSGPTGTGSPAQPPTQDTTSAGTVSLISLTPVTGAWQSRDANPMINGAVQQFFLDQDLPQVQSQGDLGYNLGRDYTKFTGQIGLDDTSAESTLHPSIEIDGDGLKIATYTPTLGHPVQINIDVTGVLRLDIKYTSPHVQNSYNIAGTLVLGNGQLTTIPGYHPPAPSSTR